MDVGTPNGGGTGPMDATRSALPTPPRSPGGTRTRLLVDDRVLVVDARTGVEPVARAAPPFGPGPENLAPRRAVPSTIPPDPVPLLGRDAEIAQVVQVLAAGETAILAAGAGYGKTALLRHLAGELGADYDDGALFLSARGRGLEDIQFEIFRSFFEVPGRRPGEADLRRHMAQIRALLLIDDVANPLPLARALAQASPYSRVVLATVVVGPVGPVGFSNPAALVGGVEVLEAGAGQDPPDLPDSSDEELDDGFPAWLISPEEGEQGEQK